MTIAATYKVSHTTVTKTLRTTLGDKHRTIIRERLAQHTRCLNARPNQQRSETARERLALAKLGSLNPNWRGGVSDAAIVRIRKAKWKRFRKEVLVRDHNRCVYCETADARLYVHHLIPVRVAPELEYEMSNVVTTCSVCHKKADDAYRRKELAFVPVAIPQSNEV